MNFEGFNIATPIMEAIQQMNFTEPTPVQLETIPLLMGGKDVLACAQTGTGKTAAFLIPMLSDLCNNGYGNGVKALILSPTRELAIQIGLEVEKFARFTKIRHAVIIGGESVEEQLYLTDRGVDILIATPGRLNHLMMQRLVNMRSLQWLVLDEGDRMLDMGFIGVIRKIVSQLPRKRRSALFSATLREDTVKLAKEMLYRACKVNLVNDKPDLSLVKQSAYYVDKPNKVNLLDHLLKQMEVDMALIFVRTKADAEKLSQTLNKLGYNAAALHGDQEQFERQQAYRDFKSGRSAILVATDLAARGIDVPTLRFVFNFELPNEPETYIHRIGRTGRAGQQGEAVSLCSNAELRFLKPIKKLVGKSIEIIEKHPFSYEPRKKDDK